MANATASRPSPTPTTPSAEKPAQIKLMVTLDEECTLLVDAIQRSAAANDKFGIAHKASIFVRQAVRQYAKSLSIKATPRATFLAAAGGDESEE